MSESLEELKQELKNLQKRCAHIKIYVNQTQDVEEIKKLKEEFKYNIARIHQLKYYIYEKSMGKGKER